MKNTNQKHSTTVVESDTGTWPEHKTTTDPYRRRDTSTAGGRWMNDAKQGADPLGSYWRYRLWLPLDRGVSPTSSPAEPSLRNVERGFRSKSKPGEKSDNKLSETQLSDIWHNLLDEMHRKWDEKNKHGAPYTPRRLWEAYEATSMGDDDEDANYCKSQVLGQLKTQYRNRILDYLKSSDYTMSAGKSVGADNDECSYSATSNEPTPEDLAAQKQMFDGLRDFVVDTYQGTRPYELQATIDGIELGHVLRRDLADFVGVDVKRLAAILRTLRSLLHDWRNQLNDSSDEDKTDQEALDALSDRIKDIEDEQEEDDEEDEK